MSVWGRASDGSDLYSVGAMHGIPAKWPAPPPTQDRTRTRATLRPVAGTSHPQLHRALLLFHSTSLFETSCSFPLLTWQKCDESIPTHCRNSIAAKNWTTDENTCGLLFVKWHKSRIQKSNCRSRRFPWCWQKLLRREIKRVVKRQVLSTKSSEQCAPELCYRSLTSQAASPTCLQHHTAIPCYPVT